MLECTNCGSKNIMHVQGERPYIIHTCQDCRYSEVDIPEVFQIDWIGVAIAVGSILLVAYYFAS